MLTPLILALFCQVQTEISTARKMELIELLKMLPREGEFFTEDAIKKATPFLPVLFALTESDIGKHDIYPFAALSRGLCDQKENRLFAVQNFNQIKHATLKLFWAAMLFEAGAPSDEIVLFLRASLKDRASKVRVAVCKYPA